MPLPLKYLNEILSGANAPSQYATKSCLYPHVVPVRNSFGGLTNLVCDCGHCIRCQQKVRDEWCTRMYLHGFQDDKFSSPWKYCYFVTLTYGSYNLYEYDSHPFRDDWLQTYPVCDTDNSSHSPAWSPSIPCILHVQKYLKRLRGLFTTPDGVSTNTISYVYCSEFGGTYGRPHYHLIVWSYKPIPEDFFSFAWGFKCKDDKKNSRIVHSFRSDRLDEDAYYWYIGHVHVVDLGAGGAFNKNVKNPENTNTAANAFKYVAKYLRKDDGTYCDSALKRMYKVYMNLPLDRSPQFLGESDPERVPDSFANSQNRCLIYNNRIYPHVDFASFKKIVRPVFVSSTRYSIGKDYFLAHRTDFENGLYKLPKISGEDLTFPSYYLRLLGMERCPIVFDSVTENGRSFRKSDYTVVRDFFRQLPYIAGDFPSLSVDSFDSETLRKRLIAFPKRSECNLTCVVLRTPDGVERCVMNLEDDTFDIFLYDRHERKYIKQRSVPLVDFCEFIITILDEEKERVDKLQPKFEQQLKLFDLVDSDPLSQVVVATYVANHNRQQRMYHMEHSDIN